MAKETEDYFWSVRFRRSPESGTRIIKDVKYIAEISSDGSLRVLSGRDNSFIKIAEEIFASALERIDSEEREDVNGCRIGFYVTRDKSVSYHYQILEVV